MVLQLASSLRFFFFALRGLLGSGHAESSPSQLNLGMQVAVAVAVQSTQLSAYVHTWPVYAIYSLLLFYMLYGIALVYVWDRI